MASQVEAKAGKVDEYFLLQVDGWMQAAEPMGYVSGLGDIVPW